jgi:hypothetical protein
MNSSGVACGSYFLELERKTQVWKFPVAVASWDGWLRPYMNSDDYQVTGTQFTDNLGQRWHTDRHAVLSRMTGGH